MWYRTRVLCTAAARTLEAPVAAVTADGRAALGLNYARMYHCRSVVGYANGIDPATLPLAPEDDGLYRIDLPSGRADLLVSHAEVIRAAALPEPPTGLVWFNHVMFNTDGSRVMFLCRMRNAGEPGLRTSLWTVRPDGSELSLQIGFEHRISHFAWPDPDRLLISTDLLGPMQFFTFTVDRRDFTPFGGGVLPEDGHACFSPDGRWLACDTYPQGSGRISQLMLYELATGAPRGHRRHVLRAPVHRRRTLRPAPALAPRRRLHHHRRRPRRPPPDLPVRHLLLRRLILPGSAR